MKKTILLLLTSSFIACSAYAGGMVGVKLGYGSLEGKRTVDPSHGTSDKATGSIESEYGAIFAEFAVNDVISVGFEVVPFEAKIDTKSTTTTDSTVTVDDFKTIYASASFGDTPFYAKVGYSDASLSVKANYDSVTIGSSSDTLEGPMVGFGAQFDSPLPFLDVLRVEANHHMFDEISITTTNTTGTADTHTKRGEADLTTISLSIAKSF